MVVNQNFVIISRSPLFSLLNASGQVDDNNFSDVALLIFVLLMSTASLTVSIAYALLSSPFTQVLLSVQALSAG